MPLASVGGCRGYKIDLLHNNEVDLPTWQAACAGIGTHGLLPWILLANSRSVRRRGLPTPPRPKRPLKPTVQGGGIDFSLIVGDTAGEVEGVVDGVVNGVVNEEVGRFCAKS